MGVRVFDLFLIGLALYCVRRLLQGRSPPLPPGPPGLPLIGNFLDLRKHATCLYKVLGGMSSKYGKCACLCHSTCIAYLMPGPIISLRALSTQIIVLNSFKTTKDLLGKKSAVTCNRPHFTVACDLVGWGNATPFLQYGDVHRKHRKFFGRHIYTNNGLMAFYPAEELEARRFVANLLRNPDDLIAHCQRCGCGSSWG